MKSQAVTFLILALSAAIPAAPPQSRHQVEITAMQFAFMPDEITLKKGEPVTLVLHSLDVTHGLKIEALHVSVDEIKKGQTKKVDVTPQEAGHFEGMCAHYCGKGHGSMRLTVNVVE